MKIFKQSYIHSTLMDFYKSCSNETQGIKQSEKQYRKLIKIGLIVCSVGIV